jgi:hypothetical protein
VCLGSSLGLKGHFTLWPKVERLSISINHIAENQEFDLSTLHTEVKVQRLLQFNLITFWRRQRTLQGSLGRMGMETQPMVKRLLIFLIIESIIDKILAVRLDGLYWASHKVGCSFGLGLWRLHSMPDCWLQWLYFIGYFQPISLDSQQSLATQSHGLLTSMAIVWSGPKFGIHVQ